MSRRADFPLLVNNPGLHYLDSAATSQKPRAVLDALVDFYETANANPHRGAYALSVEATDRYDQARRRVAQFVGVADSDCLIFTRGTTEALNLVATAWGRRNISRGDEIVVTALEHHANFVPWQQLALDVGATFRVCELTSDGRMTEYLLCLVHSGDQRIDVAAIVVNVERRASGRAHIEPSHERLRAVIAGANADPVAIENRRKIVRMHVAKCKAHDTASL